MAVVMIPHNTLPFLNHNSVFFKPNRLRRRHLQNKNPSFRCSSSAVVVVSEPPTTTTTQFNRKPTPAEVSRTIMESSSVGTLSAADDNCPISIGVRFAIVDPQGSPLLCLNPNHLFTNTRSTLHVQLEQCGLRTPQCTITGTLNKPDDHMLLMRFQSLWEKRFGEEVDSNFLHVLAVERVLQIEDFMEDGEWINSSDYKLANPDPLRNSAEQIIHEINTHNMEDVLRFCNIYLDTDIQVLEAKMVWVDRLGFDMRLRSAQNDVYEVRIPFPREVTDEKGAKSSFNCMSQLAWEVEKNYHVPDFEKVKQLKKRPGKGL